MYKSYSNSDSKNPERNRFQTQWKIKLPLSDSKKSTKQNFCLKSNLQQFNPQNIQKDEGSQKKYMEMLQLQYSNVQCLKEQSLLNEQSYSLDENYLINIVQKTILENEKQQSRIDELEALLVAAEEDIKQKEHVILELYSVLQVNLNINSCYKNNNLQKNSLIEKSQHTNTQKS